MALEKTQTVEQIEIVGQYKTVQVCYKVVITENGSVISESNMRETITAGQSYSDKAQEVQDICALVHTTDIITAYNESLNNL